MTEEAPQFERPKTSTRDLAETRTALEAWLAGRLPGAQIPELNAPPTNGMSSETILFDVRHDGGIEHLVGRIPPDPANFPVFPVYDIPAQYTVMSKVRELTAVPVPEPLWLETDPSIIGQPFFLMRRVDGVVPPDIMPYPFGGNWLFDASPLDQQKLQDTSIQVLADLHAIPEPEKHFGFLHDGITGDTPLRRHVRSQILDYYDWASKETPSPLLERCFEKLDSTWPSDEGDAVLSWGDARIGNILYREFEPVAVLDWEMASLGPREIDIAWFVYLHRMFQDTAEQYGMAGMPHFLRREDVCASYTRLTGHECRDMDWYTFLAAVRYGVVSLRTGIRGVRFGEAEMPADIDDLLMNRRTLELMLDDMYWSGIS